MMQLRRIGLIHWHILPAMDIDIAGRVGVIGENRSGKTTLLDMIQVVMTGNAGRYRKLNASATDSGRKSGDRTVHGYCVGRLSRDVVMRPDGALTYIFLGFGEGEAACTIGLALEALPAETDARTLGRFIVTGRLLSVTDFIDRVDGGEQLRDWALMRPWLENHAGASVYRDQPKQFVSDYLKALSTGRRFIDADRFRKAFVNAISFEQIGSATEFVRLYLLEQRDIRIDQLRASVATYQQLRKNIEEARRKLDSLNRLHGLLGQYKADLAVHDTQRWIGARARLDSQFHANRRLRKQVANATADLRAAQQEVAEYDRLKQDTNDELDQLRARIQAQSMGRRPEFDSQRRLEDMQRAEALRELGTLQQAVNQAAVVARCRAALDSFAGPVVDLIAQAYQAADSSRLPPAWPADATSLAALLDEAAPRLKAVLERCRQEAEAAIRRSAPLDDRSAELRRRIADIEHKGVSLEGNVETLAAELADQGFRPRILCTLLEVTDERWRHAAEALLGRDREAILVDGPFVDDAIRHLQRNRQRFRGCRIVNTRKLDPAAAVPEAGYLASVLRSDDKLAMAFVIRRIGTVRLAETIQDLHRPGRAIMRDGTYDDGLTVEMREVVRGNKIGAGAGRAGLAALRDELAVLAAELHEAGQYRAMLQAALRAIEGFETAAGRGADLLRYSDQLQRADERLDQIAADIRAMEQNIDPGLREREKRLTDTIRTYESEARHATVRCGDARRTIMEATQTLKSGDDALGADLALQAAGTAFRKLHHLRPAGRPRYRAALIEAKHDFRRLGAIAENLAREARERFQQIEREAFDQYFDFHRMFGLKADFTR
ncbi:MAG TPA: ATP-binding protein, partial [Acetobacteraceae bacterium]|nr:ATP-binding protein [Acetobacteraceae bacterium]